MDRRGIRRTKAVHINPVPILILAILLYVANILFVKHDAPWWSYPTAFLITFLTGFFTYYIQSRFAENSNPVYFSIFFFLANTSPDFVVFNKSMLAALSMSLTFYYVIKFICEEKRKDYIINATFFCTLSSIIAPSFIWFGPLIWFLMFEESEMRGSDTFAIFVSVALSYVTIFGTLYLFNGWTEAWSLVEEWAAAAVETSPTPLRELPITVGLFGNWQSPQFAHSIMLCLMALMGLYIVIAQFVRRNNLKTDDISISKVSILLTLFSLVLEWFSADGIAHWPLIAAMVSVPASHLLAMEGRHITINIIFFLLFLIALSSIIPVFELLSPYLH